MLKVITDNPYRILGVSANASPRDIIGNKNRMNAFMKVGKSVSFPLDMTKELGALNRTIDSVAAADSTLTMESDKLKAMQFWFINVTDTDAQAYEMLAAGNMGAAKTIWGGDSEMSSLHNRAVCSLIEGNYAEASGVMSKLYTQHLEEWRKAVDMPSVTLDQLASSFATTLLEENPRLDLTQLTGKEMDTHWNEAVLKQLSGPIIDKITEAINECKRARNESPERRLDAGRKLSRDGKKLLFSLRKAIPTTDNRFMSISDKLANEILQCGIDYFNAYNTDTSSKPECAREAAELAEAASMIAKGSMARERVKQNLDTLKSTLASLAPEGTSVEADQITKALREYAKTPDEISYARALVNQTDRPLANMGKKLGSDNTYYIERSSTVVSNVLHNLLAEVKKKQKAYNDAPPKSNEEARARIDYCSSIQEAKMLMDRVNGYAMKSDVRGYFDKLYGNINDLYDQATKAMAAQLKGGSTTTGGSTSTGTRTTGSTGTRTTGGGSSTGTRTTGSTGTRTTGGGAGTRTSGTSGTVTRVTGGSSGTGTNTNGSTGTNGGSSSGGEKKSGCMSKFIWAIVCLAIYYFLKNLLF